MSTRPMDLTRGERALLMRALREYASARQQLISAAHAKYARTKPEVFADHRRHHQQQIDAADRLIERLRRAITSGEIKV